MCYIQYISIIHTPLGRNKMVRGFVNLWIVLNFVVDRVWNVRYGQIAFWGSGNSLLQSILEWMLPERRARWKYYENVSAARRTLWCSGMICHVERVSPSSRSSRRALAQFLPTCDGGGEVYETRGWTRSWGREGNMRETEHWTTCLKDVKIIIIILQKTCYNLH